MEKVDAPAVAATFINHEGGDEAHQAYAAVALQRLTLEDVVAMPLH